MNYPPLSAFNYGWDTLDPTKQELFVIRSGLLSEHLKVLLAKLASTVIQRGAGIVGAENGAVCPHYPRRPRDRDETETQRTGTDTRNGGHFDKPTEVAVD
jgi:hypothetical protein